MNISETSILQPTRRTWIERLRGRNAAFIYAPVLCAISFVVAVVTSPAQTTTASLKDLFNNMIEGSIELVFLGFAASLVLATGAVDLSTPGTAALCGVVYAFVVNSTDASSGGVLLGALAVAGCAGLCGFALSELVVRLKISPLIASWALGTVWLYLAMFVAVGANGTVAGLRTSGPATNSLWTFLGEGQILIFVVVALVLGVLKATRLPDMACAVGGNERSARYLGLSVSAVRRGCFVVGALLASVAGVSMVYVNGGTASISSFHGHELTAIAIAVLGGTSMNGGYVRLWSVLCAALFWNNVSTISTSFNFPIMPNAPEGHELLFSLTVLLVAAVIRDGPAGDMIRIYVKR